MIPEIDSTLGISVFSTSFNGCGGTIRLEDGDFFVSEQLSEKTMSLISNEDGYSVYKLSKKNIDTNHALKNILKKTGVQLKSLGLKDAHAETEQYVCSMKKSVQLKNLTTEKFTLEKIGSLQKPFTKKDMIGNRFSIKIHNASDFSEFNEFEKILNFFGYQRFGSKRPVTHLVGEAIVKRDFDKAVSLLLSFTSKYDSKENTELRTKLSDRSNFSKLEKEIPPQMDLEKPVVSEIIKNDDSYSAIRALPIFMRRFFVQAYQSFLFNQTLSLAYDSGLDLFQPQDGDVCYNADAKIEKFSHDPKQRLTIPLIGYSYYKKTRFHEQISEILKQEELSPKDFYIKELQEASNEGGFRNSSVRCTDYSISNDTVNFTLSRGSFATIVLREIMKPENPLHAGF